MSERFKKTINGVEYTDAEKEKQFLLIKDFMFWLKVEQGLEIVSKDSGEGDRRRRELAIEYLEHLELGASRC